MITRTALILAVVCSAACSDESRPAKPVTSPAEPGDAATEVAKPKPEVLEPWDGDDDEAELYGAVITATSCAERMVAEGGADVIARCAPLEAAKTGFALYEPGERALFFLKQDSLYRFELERGFGGSIDVSGAIIGKKSNAPVIDPEEYTITPRAKPGAFKGCL